MEAGFEGTGKYITKRQNTVAQYITTRPILDLCERSARRLGGEGVSAVVGTGRSRFVGGEEKGGSGKIGQRGDDRRGGGNSPRMTTGQE